MNAGHDQVIQGFVDDLRAAGFARDAEALAARAASLVGGQWCVAVVGEHPRLVDELRRTLAAADLGGLTLLPTEGAQSFPHADVVVLVLDATRPLSQIERDTIASLRFANLFFAVDGVGFVDPGELAELRVWLAQVIEPERTFFVDTKAALKAQASGDQAAEVANDLHTLVTALATFLRNPANHARVLAPYARAAYARAQARLDEQRTAWRRQRALETRWRDFGRRLKDKLFADLYSYIDDIYASWEADARALISLDEVTLIDALRSLIEEERQRKIGAVIERELQKYLQAKLTAWLERAHDLVLNELATMRDELAAPVKLQLSGVERAFAVHRDPMDDERRATRQMLVGLLTGGERWLSRTAGRSMLLCLALQISSLVLRQMALVLLVASEVGNVATQYGRFRRQLLDIMRVMVRDGLKESLTVSGLREGALIEPGDLAARLIAARDPLSAYLAGRLSPEVRERLGAKTAAAQAALLDDLNVIASGELIYTSERFAGVELSNQLRRALAWSAAERSSDETARLNRLLLAEGYPVAIARTLQDSLYQAVDDQVLGLIERAPDVQPEAALRSQALTRQFEALCTLVYGRPLTRDEWTPTGAAP